MRKVNCKFGCGATVFRLHDEVGLEHQLDTAPLDQPADHPAARHRLWRYRSPWVGWISVPYLGKEVSARLSQQYQLHLEHDCEHTPKHRRPCTCGDASVHIAHTKPSTHIRNAVARTHNDRGSFRRARLHQRHQMGRPQGTVGSHLAAHAEAVHL